MSHEILSLHERAKPLKLAEETVYAMTQKGALPVFMSAASGASAGRIWARGSMRRRGAPTTTARTGSAGGG